VVPTTDIVRGIEYAVTPMEPLDNIPGWVGHGWIKDEVTGLVFILVEQGDDLADLRNMVSELLDDIADVVRTEHGVEPRLVGKGWNPKNPPPQGPG
jgi:hypothetical protein